MFCSMKMGEYIESELSAISHTGCQKYGAFVCVCVCVCVCVRARARVSFLSPYMLLVTEQNNKCNARDQVNDGMLRKNFCVKNLCHHVMDNHSRDLQASSCKKECHLNRVEPREVKNSSDKISKHQH